MNNKKQILNEDFFEGFEEFEGQDFFKNLIDIARVIVLVLDKEGKVLFVNSYFEEITNYKMEDVYGKDWFSIFFPANIQSTIRRFFKKACSGISTRGAVNDIIAKDGELLRIAWYDKVIKDNHGNMLVLLSVGHNVTEQVTLERKYVKLFEGVIKVIDGITELRDTYTNGHQKRVAVIICAIAEEMGMAPNDIETIRIAAQMHDIGKISIPLQILTKPDKLTDIEYSLIKTHANAGYNLLKEIEELEYVAKIVLQHHERINGSGYPDGLLGKDILPEAKIIAVADVVEAMSSLRPYRAPLGVDKALAEIKSKAGILYDPVVVDACVKVFEKGIVKL